MGHYRITDDEYWESPPRYQPMLSRKAELQMSWFLMGSEDDDDAPCAMVLKVAPGGVITRHAHDCERVEVVVAGSLHLPDGTVLGPGDVMTARPMEFYGPHIAGPDGCTTMEIFSRAGESQGSIYERPDGSIVKVHALKGEMRPDDAIGMDGVAERVEAILAGRVPA